jgi:hypothetical protein
MKDKYYWIKSKGDIVEIPFKKFREWTIVKSNKHKLLWIIGKHANFIDKDNSLWVSFDVLEKILALKPCS